MNVTFYFALPFGIKFSKVWTQALFWGNIVAIFALWYFHSSYYILNPGEGNGFIALGRITGLLGEYLILSQLVFIGRIRFIEQIYGFDALNRFHRFIGYSIMSLLIIHPLALVYGYAQSYGVTMMYQFGDFLANKNGVYLSFIALLILVAIVIITIERKKFHYETWYFTHIFTYAVIGLALTHQLNTGDLVVTQILYYWLALHFVIFFFVLCYRFIRPVVLLAYHGFRIERIVQETPDTTSVYITGRHLESFKFEAGQYANITILAPHVWYTHPFSFSSDWNGQSIRFTIKSLGDYTSKIAALTPGKLVMIDGPYGLFVKRRAIRPKLLLIAGGIGITPIRAMLESASREDADVVLLYASKTSKDIAFRAEIDESRTTHPGTVVHYLLSTPEAGFESGRIDKSLIVKLVPDFFDRDVFLCGPPPMMTAVVSELREIGVPSKNIHFEKFSF